MEEVSTARELAGQPSWATRFRVSSPSPAGGLLFGGWVWGGGGDLARRQGLETRGQGANWQKLCKVSKTISSGTVCTA